jgi:outer membrane protein assembly factor BamB
VANRGIQNSTIGTYLIAIAAFAIVSTPANAQWTQWGGPNQAFKSNATGISTNWPETGPKQVWQRDLGDGYSAILVDDGKLYTMFRADGKEIVVALDAKTGGTIWEHRYDSQPKEGHEHNFGDGPRGTPLIVGDKVFSIGVAGVMHCLDKGTGKVRWKHDLWGEFGGNVLNHGYSSSPIAYKDTVVALVGGENASMVAFNQTTGKVVWKNKGFQNSYSTPRLFKIDGKDHMIAFMAEQIVGFDPATGKVMWDAPCKNRWKQNVSMPVFDDKENILFFSSSGVGSKGVKLTPGRDEFKTEEVWSSRKIQLYHVTSVHEGDYVYGSTGSGSPCFMSAINMKTGKIAWRKRGFAKATVVQADGKLIILDEDGQLAIATATPDDLTVHSKVKLLDDVAWTVPTIVGKTMYIRDKNKIMAFDLS